MKRNITLLGIILAFSLVLSCAAVPVAPAPAPAPAQSQCQVLWNDHLADLSKTFLSYFHAAFSAVKFKEGSYLAIHYLGPEAQDPVIRNELRVVLVNYLKKKGFKVLERDDALVLDLAFEDNKGVKGVPPAAGAGPVPENGLAASDYTIGIEIMDCQEKPMFIDGSPASSIMVTSLVSFLDSKTGEILFTYKIKPEWKPESKTRA